MIQYKNIKEFSESELQDLFLSVEWSSGKYPEKLVLAMRNYSYVFTAWDEGKLIGLISAMDDGIMTAYIHYLLVDPKYQKMGIGKGLVDLMKQVYKDYLRIVLVAYDEQIKFYEACGFTKGDKSSPMFITSLST
ncbi:MAG: putative acetyltransferase [Alphaproteobacteria bacterium ADurb.Bin438]|nr:MAG: putative acetyltransferase [Alphaproteobacteria bacterium ADurb.Bin438]